jgi:hypothetical protein
LIPTVGRAAHASLVIDDRLFIHGGYGAQDSNSEFHVFSSMEAINLQGVVGRGTNCPH